MRVACLLVQLAAQGGHAVELDAADEAVGRGGVADAVALLRAIHETDEDAVIIEQRSHLSHTAQNELQVLNTLSSFLKSH